MVCGNVPIITTELAHITSNIGQLDTLPSSLSTLGISKCNKMENSHLAIFDEIWPTTLYYSTMARFFSIFKNS